MRSIILSAIAAVLIAVVSCQKPLDQEDVPGPFGSKLDRARLACTYTTLSGTISTNTTLSASNLYLLSGCVTVSSGVTLTIPAGTVIHGEKATRGGLIIERGATLVASGTATNPIIFTSDQAPGSRAPGDWRGIAILGQANNNSPSATFNVIRCGTSYPAGAISGVTDDTDNSGTVQYMQIHYAGYTTGSDNLPSGLLLAAVGSGTTVDHIQVTNSLKDGVYYAGGIVSSKYVVSFDNYKADFKMELGYRGYMQYGLALRKNISANDGTSGFSNGVLIQNDPTGSSNTPYTNPALSNLTILGAGYCTSGTLSSNFKNGVLFTNNAHGNLYNSVVGGWPQGLLYDGASSIANANAYGSLKWMYNTFYGYTTAASRYTFTGGTWNAASPPCTSTIGNFILNPSSLSCASAGYQSLTSGLGHSSTVCGDYCSAAPDFALSSSSLSNSSYPTGSAMDVSFFTKTTQPRGAFSTSTSWTGSWTDWCPGGSTYCP